MKLRQLIYIYIYIYIYACAIFLRKNVHGFEGWILDPSLFQSINLPQFIKKTNYDEIIVFYFFESVH